MASTTEPRNGLVQGWALGEANWKAGMDSNLKALDNWGMHLSVKDRDLLAPPGAPANGDTYILAAGTLTGAWAARTTGDLAMWSTADAAWRFKTPRVGYHCYVEDEQVLTVFKAGGWSAGVAI
jgi:hypothetical protein